MQDRPSIFSRFNTRYRWLIFGLLCLSIGLGAFLFDRYRSDERIMTHLKEGIENDLNQYIEGFKSDGNIIEGEEQNTYVYCELTYRKGKLIQWNRNDYLPPLDSINRLRSIEENSLLTVGNRLYYQIREEATEDTAKLVLIPLHIAYEIQNAFLTPYVFLGRFQNRIPARSKRYMLRVSTDKASQGIHIENTEGKFLYAIEGVPLSIFRKYWRIVAVLFWLLGGIGVSLYLRTETIRLTQRKLLGDLVVWTGLAVLRVLSIGYNMATYAKLGIFRPDILAADYYLAPSLGDFTCNVILCLLLGWLLYKRFFPWLTEVYGKLLERVRLQWPIAVVTIFLSALISQLYVNQFLAIIQNSQVSIGFNDIFNLSLYASLILVDTGVLLLVVILLISCLLKYNIMFLRLKHAGMWEFLAMFMILIGSNVLLYLSDPLPVIVISAALGLLGLVLYRAPHALLDRYDLSNYSLLIIMFAMFSTYGIQEGIALKTERQIESIAKQINEGGVAKTLTNFTKLVKELDVRDNKQMLRSEWTKAESPERFLEWLKERFLSSTIGVFDMAMFLYDADGNRIDEAQGVEPYFNLDADISLNDQGQEVYPGLYQISVLDLGETFDNVFIGEYELDLEDSSAYLLRLEMYPSTLGSEGLYPSLLLEEQAYENLNRISSVDFAFYRNGTLYNKRGNSSFERTLPEHDKISQSSHKKCPTYNEYTHFDLNDSSKIVVVRYPKQGIFGIITAFSCIFYLYVLAAFLMLLPGQVAAGMENRVRFSNVPLRLKIQIVLLGISILPMIIIIFLSSSIKARYYEQVLQELNTETTRIAKIVKDDYLLLRSELFGRITVSRQLKERIQEIRQTLPNDIHIFDEGGKLLASTQPLVFESGISSGLMDPSAYHQLRSGLGSDIVMRERIGNQEFFSGYQPILGNEIEPVGYVNVPYLTKQDQVNEQVNSFLAYLVNIYLVLFLFVGIVTVFLSNTITQPLLLIQRKLAQTSFGNVNEPIEYEAEDEIGAIVDAYNVMVEKIAESEQKLAATQRQLAWKWVARQVAHEIKNPLTPMKLRIQLLMRTSQMDKARAERMLPKVMKTLLVQIDSLVNIANSFSEFANMPRAKNSVFVLNEVLHEVTDLYENAENAELVVDIAEGEFPIYADRDQVSRVFNNVIKNALQAIEDNGIVKVSMKTNEEMCMIEIEDNGSGMTEEVQKRLFEPKFSTKTSGMGLGLAIVKKIIETANGNIDFKSTLGEGTTFYIQFPRSEDV